MLLLFHQHEAGMHGAHHTELMARIQSEHLSYSLAGIAVGLTRGLSDLETPWQGVFQKVWPLLMTVLGILLMFYRGRRLGAFVGRDARWWRASPGRSPSDDDPGRS